MSKKNIRDYLKPAQRYVRAVNIERDRGDAVALDGYIATDNVKAILSRLAIGLGKASAQRAWKITGPYGGGKSALGLFFLNLLESKITKSRMPGSKLTDELRSQFRQLPAYVPVVVTGAAVDASIAIAKALERAISERRSSVNRDGLKKTLSDFIEARKLGDNSPHDLFPLLDESIEFLRGGVSGGDRVILIIDEMGLLISHATDKATDINASFFQVLAERAGGRSDDFALLAFLHQRFEDYAKTFQQRDEIAEWSKVSERFEDIKFDEPFESTAELVADAIGADEKALKSLGITAEAVDTFNEAAKNGVLMLRSGPELKRLASGLYPIHPTTLLALYSFMRQFGQNERSLFSFIRSSEPFGFQDFVERTPAEKSNWYRIPNFCDYLLSQGVLRTFDDERQKRWSLLQEILRSAPLFERDELECLKTIGVLNLLEPVSGLPVTAETIALSISDLSSLSGIQTHLNNLVRNGVIFKRPATNEYCIWPRSSVDLASEYKRTLAAIPEQDSLEGILELLPAGKPIFAHRHYLSTGTPRSAAVLHLEQPEFEAATRLIAENPSDGHVFVAPVYPGATRKQVEKAVCDLSRKLPPSCLIALRAVSKEELQDSRRLLAWRQIKKECKELRVDTYANSEVQRNIEALSNQLTDSLMDLRVPGRGSFSSTWFYRGQSMNLSSGKELNSFVSGVFDDVYPDAPRVKNELINRTSISTAAAGARQKLIEYMFESDAEENLGIKKTPPEKAIYLSVLRQSELHRAGGSQWAINEPTEADPSRWKKFWSFVLASLEDEGVVSVAALLDRLREPPFGLRESISLIGIVAILKVHQNEIILREKGTYVTRIEGAHLARLAKRPEHFDLHRVAANKSLHRLLESYASCLKKTLRHDETIGSDVGSISRALFSWYLSLPEVTRGTTKLSDKARLALSILSKAGDPVDLLTAQLPKALGITVPKSGNFSANSVKTFVAEFERLLSEVEGHYSNLQQDVARIVADEAGASDLDSARQALISQFQDIESDALDFNLQSFVVRTLDSERSDLQWLNSLAGLFGGRPIEMWRDDTLSKFRVEYVHALSILRRLAALNLQFSGTLQTPSDVFAIHIVDAAGRDSLLTIKRNKKGTRESTIERDIRALLEEAKNPTNVLAELLAEYSSASRG